MNKVVDLRHPVGVFVNRMFNASHDFLSSYGLRGRTFDQVFSDPVSILPRTNDNYVVEKEGKVWMIYNESKAKVLDITQRVHSIDDAGLINAVLHPAFNPSMSDSSYLFVMYRFHPRGDKIGPCDSQAFIRLSRFTWDAAESAFDDKSELVLVQQYDPHCWHMGGGMFFGPDGFLYFALGDAGGINDEFKSTQQISDTFFGGLHRIDVDRDATRSHPIRRQPENAQVEAGEGSYTQYYYIPNDNPWVSESGENLEEFYALGLRNPHRMSYDTVEDKIWVADVGQARREELNMVERGDNLQWPFMEGSLPGPHQKPEKIIGNSRGPVFEYDHSIGTAIIGGFVYRGSKFPDLYGKYIFADDGTRKVWAYNFYRDSMEYLATVPAGGIGPKNGISSVEKDDEGNIFVLKLFGTDMDGGQIYQLADNDGAGGLPRKLSDLHVFREMDPSRPALGLIPYEINVGQWNNGMKVQHWVAIPNDGVFSHPSEQVKYSDHGSWIFPYGTVFVQHFQFPLEGGNNWRDIETRFLVISEEGQSYGVGYKWREDGTEADLIVESHQDTFVAADRDETVFSFLSPSDCLNCHNASNGFVLGVKSSQMNHSSSVADINQIEWWHRNDVFGSSYTSTLRDSQSRMTPWFSDQSLPKKIASYLDVNCSACHFSRGMMPSFDARYREGEESLADLILKKPISPNSDKDGYLVVPGEPEESILFQRINTCTEQFLSLRLQSQDKLRA